MKLILASSSPRRKEILTKYGYTFSVVKPDVDESMDNTLTPYENVLLVSHKKGLDVYKDNQNDVILSCDTIVTLDGVIYGKPHSKEDARSMMKTFSGKTHEVVSGVSIMSKSKSYNFYVTSYVTFKDLTDSDIEEYISTDEPYDKAGGYAIQGIGNKLIDKYEGSLNNIIGLPIEEIKDKIDEILGD